MQDLLTVLYNYVQEDLIGQFVDIHITGANKWSLSGEVV